MSSPSFTFSTIKPYWTTFTLFLIFFFAFPAQAIPLVGSACLIRYGDKVVVIKEEISGKLALPGGRIDPTNSPEQAAVREVYEEIGIHVDAVKLLKLRGNTTLFACVAKQPIPTTLITSYTQPLTTTESDDLLISTWQAKHFTKEVKRAYLLSAENITPKDYRYPNDVPLIQHLLPQVPNSEITVNAADYDAVSRLHQWELTQIKSFQQEIKSMPDSDQSLFQQVISVFNLPGEKLFIGLLLLVVTVGFGVTAMLYLSSVLVSVTFIASVMKLALASPRPFYIWPELQQTAASGFGLPSGHTLMATVLWGLLWYNLPLLIHRYRSNFISNPRAFRIKTLPLLIIAISLQAIARVWLGVHFISDTLLGLGVGIVLLVLLIWWQRSGLAYQHVRNWQFWALFSVIIALGVSYFQVPQQVYLLACTLAMSAAVFIDRGRSRQTITYPQKIKLAVALLGSVLAIGFLSSLCVELVISTVAILLIKTLTIIVMVMACVLMTVHSYRLK
ncbi:MULTISPECIES: phosphatase PAP2 family protein [unclassified Photobacterium]|uniref:bifunctional NUDIX hydrolase/phosphatase PAP2 family protein n=1 Tax=unclassified Photobacterium TaxID=2628852 RepID=UPI001EE059CE|nr:MULTISPECIES: phosphatase PAP2 family protein [unclassified Photobacterium]